MTRGNTRRSERRRLPRFSEGIRESGSPGEYKEPSGLMTQLVRRQIKHTPLDLHDRYVLGSEPVLEKMQGSIRINLVHACEDIEGTEAVFGPCMNGKVGFGDDDNAADTVWREPVETGLTRWLSRARRLRSRTVPPAPGQQFARMSAHTAQRSNAFLAISFSALHPRVIRVPSAVGLKKKNLLKFGRLVWFQPGKPLVADDQNRRYYT
jgi:hypothetical protein